MTDVATRPWQTPRLRAADPRSSFTQEYVKDHAPQDVSLGTRQLYQKSTCVDGKNLKIATVDEIATSTKHVLAAACNVLIVIDGVIYHGFSITPPY